MTNKKKILSLVLVLALVLGTIGGTLAWLKAETAPKVNTFTVGKVGVTLDETERPYKMVPGTTLDKDPKVTLTQGSEAAYLFVKIEEKNNLPTYIDYDVDDAWTMLEEGVYYIETPVAGTEYPVLEGNKVTVNATVTSEQMELAEKNKPELSFTAYAIQKMKDNKTAFTPADAWKELNKK